MNRLGDGIKGGILTDLKDEGECQAAEEQIAVANVIEPKLNAEYTAVKHVRLLLANGSRQRRRRVCFDTTM
jgi:hypothetical protein